jgi:hypothetical protein
VNIRFSRRPKPGSCLIFIADIKPQYHAFANALRTTYGKVPTAGALDRARVSASRAELAVALEDSARAEESRHELRHIELTIEDRQHCQDELQAADRLEQWIMPG